MMNSQLAALTAVALLWLQPPARSAAADALDHARELYESASYEQALDLLNRLQPTDTSTVQDQQAARRYRVLCLVALDRNGDAERVLDEMIRADPMSPPLPGELSPRVEALVKQSRQRVAKSIVKETYEQGRDLYDRGQFADASARLSTVMALFEDPTLGLKSEPSLADLRLLADGFLALSQALAESKAAAQQAGSPARNSPSAVAVSERVQPSPAAIAAPSPSGGASGQQPGRAANAVGFVPPKAIAQPTPPLDRAMAGYATRREGELEIEVGADGSVVYAAVRVPTNPVYDALLVETVKREWKYEPATRLGVPVPYRFRIRVVLR